MWRWPISCAATPRATAHDRRFEFPWLRRAVSREGPGGRPSPVRLRSFGTFPPSPCRPPVFAGGRSFWGADMNWPRRSAPDVDILAGKIFAELLRAARAGEPCPTGGQLMNLTGASEGAVYRRLCAMDRDGVIRIHKITRLTRRIEIPGENVSTAPTRRQGRRAAAVRAPSPGTAPRRCLRCRRNFDSEGIHNRVCEPCKSSQAWRAADDGASALPARPAAAMPGAG